MQERRSTDGLAGTPAPEPPSLLRAALDGLPLHVCVLDHEATIRWVNRAWVRFATDNGADPACVGLGTNYLAACSPEGRDAASGQEFAAGLREVLGGQRDRFETEYPCHAPNELRWFVVCAEAVEWDGRRGAVVTHQPVTGRKLAELKQRERDKLESLGTLAGGVAHDFNNVLSVVLANAAMVLEDGKGLDAASRQRLRLLWDAAQRARGLVQQILSFSRGRVREARPQSLGRMVRSLLPMLRATLPAQVRIDKQLADRGLAVLVDRTEFEQVLINLCANGAQAMQGRPGVIGIHLERLPQGSPLRERAGLRAEGEFVHLMVRDSGHGMDESTRARIFEPFFTTKPEGEGTGIGLSVVRGIVERNRAAILVDSAPGEGTAFHILWPCTEAPAHEAVAAPTLPPAPSPAERGLRPLAPVLMVDDDEVVGLTLQALLERAGYRVHRVLRPGDALAALAAAPQAYTLLLSDQSMPEMSGIELAGQARAIAPGLPVVLVTGWADEGLQQQAQASGVRALVSKEQVLEDLMPALERVLGDAALQDRRVTPVSAHA